MSEEIEEDILRSLRRITRAIDLNSRRLANAYGLTGPQLVCLRAIGARRVTTPSNLAREVSLSQATITGIIDRLVARQLVTRGRGTEDRRQVTVALTAAGEALILAAPSPLQEQFAAQLAALGAEERESIRLTLRTVATMMGGDVLTVAPVLAPGADLEDLIPDPNRRGEPEGSGAEEPGEEPSF